MNLLVTFSLVFIIRCNSEFILRSEKHSIDDKNSEHIITKIMGRTTHSTAAPDSIQDILLVNSSQIQSPLIFSPEINSPKIVIQNNGQNGDRIIFMPNEEFGAGTALDTDSSGQPPFFASVQHKPFFMAKTRNKRNKNYDSIVSESDLIEEYGSQPLPPSTQPFSERKKCTALGRMGTCFPFYSLSNSRDCLAKGGFIAMDVVRCSWVRVCCVTN